MAHGIERKQPADDVPLVVRGASGERLAVPNGKRKWVRFPEIERLSRLYVVMVVKEDCRCGRLRGARLAENHGRAARYGHHSYLQAACAHKIGDQIGAWLKTLSLGGDAWYRA